MPPPTCRSSLAGSAPARGSLAADRVVGLVLLLACMNLASFLVARALDRGGGRRAARPRRDRGALARPVLVESALLGLGGAAAGLVLALVLLDVLLSVDLPLPYGMRLDLHLGLDWRVLFDWRVLALTAGAGVLAGGLLGLVPAIQSTRTDLGSALRAGRRGSVRPGLSGGQRDGRRPHRHVARVARRAGLFLRSWQQTLAWTRLRPCPTAIRRHDAGRAVNT